MAIDIKNLIETIVIVMLENRSFDHMLGYLSLKEETNRTDIDGIADPTTPVYINDSVGETYSLFPMKDEAFVGDLPHGRDLVDVQLAKSATSGKCEMTGFVEAYRQFMNVRKVRKKAPPMGFMKDGGQVPTLDFFAKNFTVCDHWFAPLPADTQPNRLMALSGFTTAVFNWDHVFLKGFTAPAPSPAPAVKVAGIVRDTLGTSDHDPVWAVAQLP